MTPAKRIQNSFSHFLKPLTLADRILLLSLIILAVSSMFFIPLLQKQGEAVHIFHEDNMIYQYKLNEEKELLIKTEIGFIQIFIKDKKVWVNDSTCPAKVCKKMGKISKIGQTIVCVPNKIFIQITGKNNDQYLNLITQ